jgi:DNA-binding beta-propeller fold protein YncE
VATVTRNPRLVKGAGIGQAAAVLLTAFLTNLPALAAGTAETAETAETAKTAKTEETAAPADSAADRAAAGAMAQRAAIDHWTLGGSGGWDYLAVDPARQRLFVSRSDRVEVVETALGRIVATIAGTDGVHGVALAEALKRGYTSNGRSDSITVFDLDSLAVLATVPVTGHNPDAILFEPKRQRLFTFNGRSHDATVFDAQSMQVLATLPLPDKPEFAAADGDGSVYVNIESSTGQLVKIGGEAPRVEATWSLDGCEQPTGLAIDRARRRLFSTCHNGIMVITDARDGRAVARAPIGAGPDAAAFDDATATAFSSNGEGSVSVVRETAPGRFETVATLPTERGARTMALDPAAARIFLVTAQFKPAEGAGREGPPARRVPIDGTAVVLVVRRPSVSN